MEKQRQEVARHAEEVARHKAELARHNEVGKQPMTSNAHNAHPEFMVFALCTGAPRMRQGSPHVTN